MTVVAATATTLVNQEIILDSHWAYAAAVCSQMLRTNSVPPILLTAYTSTT